MAHYEIARTDAPPSIASVALTRAPWSGAMVAPVAWYHRDGSDHKPQVEFRALYDREALYVHFAVSDRYVRCLHTRFQAPVYEDSCCELFLAPRGARGYCNIEINAIGALMISYITDPTRTEQGFAARTMLGEDADRAIERHTSLTGPIDPEIAVPTTYELSYRVPFQLIERYSGCTTPRAGDRWSGNIYKCSENSTHPHWGAWSPIGDRLEYHQPDRFGAFIFQ